MHGSLLFRLRAIESIIYDRQFESYLERHTHLVTAGATHRSFFTFVLRYSKKVVSCSDA